MNFVPLVMTLLLVQAPPDPTGDGRLITSSKAPVQMLAPIGWAEWDSKSKDAVLQVKSDAKHGWTLVISESKQDLKHKTIDEYAESILKLEAKKSTLTDRQVSEPQQLKIHEHAAVRYEVHGTRNNVNLVYVKTFIETEHRWNQVMCWTVPSHLAECQHDFTTMAESFDEVPPSNDAKK